MEKKSLKKIGFSLVVFAVVFGLVGCGKENDENKQEGKRDTQTQEIFKIDTSDWKTYQNKESRFEFKYPEDWAITIERPEYSEDGKYTEKDKEIMATLKARRWEYVELNLSSEKFSPYITKTQMEISVIDRDLNLELHDDIRNFISLRDDEQKSKLKKFNETLKKEEDSLSEIWSCEENEFGGKALFTPFNNMVIAAHRLGDGEIVDGTQKGVKEIEIAKEILKSLEAIK